MLNTKLENRKQLWAKLGKLGLVHRLRTILGPTGSYMLRPEDGMFVPVNPGYEPMTPWVYIKQTIESRCNLYQRVFFGALGHIPSFCRSCWKVVVRPRNLIELFDLYEIQKQMDVPSKCGIERREIVKGLYGGYFYCRSKKEGLERYKDVREIVNRYLSPETSVILKRYCTEFEITVEGQRSIHGPSNEVGDVTQEEREMEIYVEAHFPDSGFAGLQPNHLIASIMQTWIKWAYQHGDPTWIEFTDNSLLTPVVTYHQEEK